MPSGQVDNVAYRPVSVKGKKERYAQFFLGVPGMRQSARQRGYDRAWEQVRARFLAHPGNRFCRRCAARGEQVLATDVDHIVSIRRGGSRLDWANLQPLCARCHGRKTVRQDGGFGRQPYIRGCDINGRPLDPNHPWNKEGDG